MSARQIPFQTPAATLTAARVTSRRVTGTVQNMLWGRSAGRCEFAGCNKPLWKSTVTQERVNIAQKAHIYAFSSRGPRARRGIPVSVLNSVDNLMLVCHECHQKIDRRRDGGRYKAPLLFQMKATHEQRVQRVSGISASCAWLTDGRSAIRREFPQAAARAPDSSRWSRPR